MRKNIGHGIEAVVRGGGVANSLPARKWLAFGHAFYQRSGAGKGCHLS